MSVYRGKTWLGQLHYSSHITEKKRAVLRYLLFPLFGQITLKANHQYKLYHEIISGEKAVSNMIY